MKRYDYMAVEVIKECPFCGEKMTFTGIGYTTYGKVDVWHCQEHGDTWIGSGSLVNLGLTLA